MTIIGKHTIVCHGVESDAYNGDGGRRGRCNATGACGGRDDEQSVFQ